MTAPLPTERSSGARTPGDRSQVARSLTYIELWDIVQPDVANASPHLRITRHPSQHGQYFPAERGVAPGPFPLGKTGGLIEARIPRRRLLANRVFPLGKTGGLIEASGDVRASCQPRTRFPLGKTGGLIEACRPLRQLRAPRAFPLGKTGGLIEAGRDGAASAA